MVQLLLGREGSACAENGFMCRSRVCVMENDSFKDMTGRDHDKRTWCVPVWMGELPTVLTWRQAEIHRCMFVATTLA